MIFAGSWKVDVAEGNLRAELLAVILCTSRLFVWPWVWCSGLLLSLSARRHRLFETIWHCHAPFNGPDQPPKVWAKYSGDMVKDFHMLLLLYVFL